MILVLDNRNSCDFDGKSYLPIPEKEVCQEQEWNKSQEALGHYPEDINYFKYFPSKRLVVTFDRGLLDIPNTQVQRSCFQNRKGIRFSPYEIFF